MSKSHINRSTELNAVDAEHHTPRVPPYILQYPGKGWYVPEDPAVPDGPQRYQRDDEHLHAPGAGGRGGRNEPDAADGKTGKEREALSGKRTRRSIQKSSSGQDDREE